MSNTMPNGKTYTEVLLDVYDKLDNVEQRILGRIDVIANDNADCREKLARGDAKFAGIDNKLDGKGGINERVKENTGGIKTNADNIVKVRNLNATITAFFSGIAALVGLSK